MKDLDFDELDKAVNSLMTSVPKDEPPKEDEVKTVTLPASTQTTEPLLPLGSPVTTPKAPPTAPLPQTPATATSDTPKSESLATRRGGRFMDMVHPSADMKKSEQPAKPVSRQGATLSPVSSPDTIIEQTPPTASSTLGEPDAVTQPVPDDAPTSHQPPLKSDWPDPLEMANFKTETEESTPKEVSEPTPDVKTEAATGTNEKKGEPTPLTSPFLPDTKVEKRPLGGSAASSDVPPALPVQGIGKENLTVDDPDAQLPASPTAIEPPLPEELQGDLVAIESGTPKEPVEPATPPIDMPEKPVPLSTEDPEEAAKPEEKPVHTGPVSIPQQYKEEPSTGDKESGAIYDTDTYHQPLTHPAKKKSGWLWVILILLILVLGAAAGVALYLSGLI